MAYFLRKTAANNNLAAVNIASRINFMRAGSAGYTGNFEVEFEIQMNGTSLPFISQDILDGQRLLIFTNATTLEIRRSAGNISWTLPVSAANRCIYRLVGDSSSNTIQLFQNGVSLGTRSGADFIWIQTLFGFGSNARNYDFYFLKLSNNGSLVHHYDPSASNGTGTTLIDAVGGNNGTLVNFPSDNSQWVFYDGAGGEEQITSSGGIASALTGGASTTVREFTGDWGAPEILFSEAQPIEQISLTFDQLGRPLVFYRVGEDTLKLYWYDPVAQQNVTTTLTTGKDPTACFDFPQDTGQSFTDVLLFYVRENQVFMRIQRDRYAIEYPCPAIQPGLKINSAGLRVDNRLQVVYQFKDEDFVVPSIPAEPPPIVQLTEKYFHLNNDFTGSLKHLIKTNFRPSGFLDEQDMIFELRDRYRSLDRGSRNKQIELASQGYVGYTQEYMNQVVKRELENPSTLFEISGGGSTTGLIDSLYGFVELSVKQIKDYLNISYYGATTNIRMTTPVINNTVVVSTKFIFSKRPAGSSKTNLKIELTKINQATKESFIEVAYDGLINIGLRSVDYNYGTNSSRYPSYLLNIGGSLKPRNIATGGVENSLNTHLKYFKYTSETENYTWVFEQEAGLIQNSNPTGFTAELPYNRESDWKLVPKL